MLETVGFRGGTGAAGLLEAVKILKGLAVDRVSDGMFIGWCSLNSWNPDHRSASLGYCYNDAAWGHGYATETAHAVLAVRIRNAGPESRPS